MTAVSLTQQQYQQFIDSISGLEARVATLQTHAEAQQEQIRVSEMLIQQLRTGGANPPPPTRTFLQRQVTEGGAFKALSKCQSTRETIPSTTIGPSVRDEYSHERMRDAGLLQCTSGRVAVTTMAAVSLTLQQYQQFIDKISGWDERFAGLLEWISGQTDEVNEDDVLEYRRTTDLSSTDMDWLNSELCALLAIKTSDTAMASIKSLEEVEVR